MESQEPKSIEANEPMLSEESFHNCFLYFIEAVNVLSLDAAEQREAMGNFNVAWEIKHDVLDGGIALINWPAGYFSSIEKDAIAQIVVSLSRLPGAALLSDNILAMNHIVWDDLRVAAKLLRVQLDDAVKRNQAFFQRKRDGG